MEIIEKNLKKSGNLKDEKKVGGVKIETIAQNIIYGRPPNHIYIKRMFYV